MKTTTMCGRCEAKFDIEEGLKIGTCYSPVNRKVGQAAVHVLEVDRDTDEGVRILKHIEKKPQPVRQY